MNRIPGELRGDGMVAVLGGLVPVQGGKAKSLGDRPSVDVLVRPEGLTMQVVQSGNGLLAGQRLEREGRDDAQFDVSVADVAR